MQAVVSEQQIERVRLQAPDMPACFTSAVDFLENRQVPIKEVNVAQVQADNAPSTASFIVSTKNIYGWEQIKSGLQEKLKNKIAFDTNLAALSLIGEGLNRNNLTLLQTLGLLADSQVPVLGTTTTSFRISLLVPADQIEKSVARCHSRWVTDRNI